MNSILRRYYIPMVPTTITEFAERIARCWTRQTSYWPDQWTEDNPALGQCLVTSLVARDVFHGGLVKGKVNGTEHYWNYIPNIGEIDFTRSQFGEGPHSTVVIGYTGPYKVAPALEVMEFREQFLASLKKDVDLLCRLDTLRNRYALLTTFPHHFDTHPAFGDGPC